MFTEADRHFLSFLIVEYFYESCLLTQGKKPTKKLLAELKAIFYAFFSCLIPFNISHALMLMKINLYHA